MKYMLLGALVLSGACQAGSLTKINESALRLPEMMSTVKLLHNQDRFLVSDDEGLHEIDNCWLDSDLRTIARNPVLLDKFQQFGYISVNKSTDGHYILKKHVRGKGGGPVLGALFAGATYAICYGTAIAGITTLAAPAMAAAPALAGPAVGGLLGTIAGGGAAGATGGAILSLGGGTLAATATQAGLVAAGAAANGGGVLATFAAVNTAIGGLAATMGAIGTAIPFL